MSLVEQFPTFGMYTYMHIYAASNAFSATKLLPFFFLSFLYCKSLCNMHIPFMLSFVRQSLWLYTPGKHAATAYSPSLFFSLSCCAVASLAVAFSIPHSLWWEVLSTCVMPLAASCTTQVPSFCLPVPFVYHAVLFRQTDCGYLSSASFLYACLCPGNTFMPFYHSFIERLTNSNIWWVKPCCLDLTLASAFGFHFPAMVGWMGRRELSSGHFTQKRAIFNTLCAFVHGEHVLYTPNKRAILLYNNL